MRQEITVFWFRRDLRIKDNHGLYHAFKSPYPVLPLFIYDCEILDDIEDRHDARVNFIYNTVEELYHQFAAAGGSLRVEMGSPLRIFKKLFAEFNIRAVYLNRDYEPQARLRDAVIEDLAKEKGASFQAFKDQVIFDEREILSDSGRPYLVYTPFKRKWLAKYNLSQPRFYASEHQLQHLLNGVRYRLPQLSELGFKPTTIATPDRVIPVEIIKNYERDRDFPSRGGTTRLGIHLRFGTVSIRKAVRAATVHSASWLNELIWREFYCMILANFPHVTHSAFNKKYDGIPWRDDPESFDRWCQGMTGYPLVDAGMRELNITGFMHNRLRMITAGFLTKHLLIDWRWGESYFADKLLDYELASNNGGWQWAAGTGTDAQPYYRVFNPDRQQLKFDKNLEYVKKWVPEWGSETYPDPIIDHKAARERAIRTFKKAVG